MVTRKIKFGTTNVPVFLKKTKQCDISENAYANFYFKNLGEYIYRGGRAINQSHEGVGD
jgi:hypothetical protein